MAGTVVGFHGIDNAAARLSQMLTGQEPQSFTEKGISNGLQGIGVSEETANIAATYADAALGMVLTAGTTALTSGPKVVASGEAALIGGRKADIPVSSTLERHEIPSASTMKKGLGMETADVPVVQLPNSMHNRTASFGGTTAARNYRKAELALIQSGSVQEAFDMGVNDLKAIINTPHGKLLLKTAGLSVKDVNKAIGQMTQYFNSIK